jgi:hypothetical protein
MVAMTAGLIVLASVLQTFTVIHAQATRQQRTLARQQDLRLGLEVFEQEVRLATPASIVKAAPDELVFLANVNALATNTTAEVPAGQTLLPVQDDSGWSEGKTVMVCGSVVCESHRLARNGQRGLLTLAEPVGMALPGGVSVEIVNRVSYYTRRDDAGGLKLMRMVDGGASTIIGDLRSARFVYQDGSGRQTAVPASVRRVSAMLISGHSAISFVRDVSLRS